MASTKPTSTWLVEPNADPVQLRFRQTFSVPIENYQSKWSSLWEEDFLPWDRGFSSPALVDLLSAIDSTSSTTIPPAPAVAALLCAQSSPRKRAIVPGCGRGYDVAVLAKYGYDSYGLDVSEKAVEMARLYHGENPTKGDGVGKIEIVAGDFFTDEWVVKRFGEGEGEGSFDLIYDYTFLCALHPTMRPKWAKQMAHLLAKSTGLLICLEYPLFKDLRIAGPPWGLRSEIYDELLSGEFELVERFQPGRTHQVGEGSDRVSVWRRR